MPNRFCTPKWDFPASGSNTGKSGVKCVREWRVVEEMTHVRFVTHLYFSGWTPGEEWLVHGKLGNLKEKGKLEYVRVGIPKRKMFQRDRSANELASIQKLV